LNLILDITRIITVEQEKLQSLLKLFPTKRVKSDQLKAQLISHRLPFQEQKCRAGTMSFAIKIFYSSSGHRPRAAHLLRDLPTAQLESSVPLSLMVLKGLP